MEDFKKIVGKCRKLSLYGVVEWCIFVLIFSVSLFNGENKIIAAIYFIIMWILFMGSGYFSYDLLKKTFIPKEITERYGNLIKVIKWMILCNLAMTFAMLGGGLGMWNVSGTITRLYLFLPLIIMFTGIKVVFIVNAFKLSKKKVEDKEEEKESINEEMQVAEIIEPIAEYKTEEIAE